MAPSAGPILIDAARTRAALPMGPLVDALQAAFVAGGEAPLRHRHALPEGSTLLLMPAWQGRSRRPCARRSVRRKAEIQCAD